MHFQRKGFHSLTPYLLLPEIGPYLNFLVEVFEAEIKMKFDRPDGTVMHVELRIGDSMLMMGEPPDGFEIMTAGLYIYVLDCDLVYQKAMQSGCTSVMEPTTKSHAGERYGGVRDMRGNVWWIATHVEDVDEEEEKKRLNSR